MRNSPRGAREMLDLLIQVGELKNDGLSTTLIAEKLNTPRSTVRDWIRMLDRPEYLKSIKEQVRVEEKMAEHTAKLSASKQRFMDRNRVREKTMREVFRQRDCVETISQELIDLIKKYGISKPSKVKNTSSQDATAGVIHLSDLHFNECIDLPHNQYNFDVAAARLAMLSAEAKRYFKCHGIKNVLIAQTGDLMNSDRRLDEICSNVTNRTMATIASCEIMRSFIYDLAEDFNLTTAYVTGNESRVGEELVWGGKVASDNYDTMIYNILRFSIPPSVCQFKTNDESNPNEVVVSINGYNILMLHGHGSLKGDVEKAVSQLVGRYSMHDIKVDYVVFGHLHSARLSDTFSRSSSLCGSNCYAENKLNLTGRASQNLYIIRENRSLDAIKVDLQSPNCDGYKYNKKLEAYAPVAKDMMKDRKVVFEVVV